MSPEAKVVIRGSDMPEDMLNFAIQTAEQAMQQFTYDKEVAQSLRSTFVKKYAGVWHCFVGHNMGAYYTYEDQHFVYFYKGQTAVLLFKTG